RSRLRPKHLTWSATSSAAMIRLERSVTPYKNAAPTARTSEAASARGRTRARHDDARLKPRAAYLASYVARDFSPASPAGPAAAAHRSRSDTDAHSRFSAC